MAVLNRLLKWVKGPVGWLVFGSFVIVGAVAALAVKGFWRRNDRTKGFKGRRRTAGYKWGVLTGAAAPGTNDAEALYVLLEVDEDGSELGSSEGSTSAGQELELDDLDARIDELERR